MGMDMDQQSSSSATVFHPIPDIKKGIQLMLAMLKNPPGFIHGQITFFSIHHVINEITMKPPGLEFMVDG